MFNVVLSLIILAAVLLVLVILAQNSKGGGLTSQFGGSGASNMIGVKKTGDLLEKLTWGLIITIFALAMSTNFLDAPIKADGLRDRANEATVPTPALDLGGGETIEVPAGENNAELPGAEDVSGETEDGQE